MAVGRCRGRRRRRDREAAGACPGAGPPRITDPNYNHPVPKIDRSPKPAHTAHTWQTPANWRAELALWFGITLREAWGGSRAWPGVRARSALMSVWRAYWLQRCSGLGFLSQLLRGTPVAMASPP
jgi:hypothetical protein